MRQAYLARIDEHRGVDFIVGADHDIDQAQDRAQDNAEGARVVPLIGTEVDIERHWCTHLVCRLLLEKKKKKNTKKTNYIKIVKYSSISLRTSTMNTSNCHRTCDQL